jgi:hypothetical protein
MPSKLFKEKILCSLNLFSSRKGSLPNFLNLHLILLYLILFFLFWVPTKWVQSSLSSIGGTIAHHDLWTLQLSPLVRPEDGFEKMVETSKF